MTYNTGNAVPSRDPRDLLDNAESLDIRVNSRTERSTPDRLGVERKTWHGMECDFAEGQIDRAARFDTFLAGSAYQLLGDYAAGIELTARNQVFLYAGEYYRAAAATALPYTLTGTWATDSAYLVGVGDAVLRQDLAISSDPAKGAALIGRAIRQIKSAQELRSTPGRYAGDQISLLGWYASKPGVGGGLLSWDAYSTQVDDGGSVFAVDGVVNGRWVRDITQGVWAEWFGAMNDGTDDLGTTTAAVWAAIRSMRANESSFNQYIGGPIITAYKSGTLNFGRGVFALLADTFDITQDLGLIIQGQGSRGKNQALPAATTLLQKGVSSGFFWRHFGNGARSLTFRDLDICYENSDFTGDVIDSLSSPGLTIERCRVGCFGGSAGTRVQTARSAIRTTYDEFVTVKSSIIDGVIDGWWSDNSRTLGSASFGGWGSNFDGVTFYDVSGSMVRHDATRTRATASFKACSFNPINVNPIRAFDVDNIEGLVIQGCQFTPSTASQPTAEWFRVFGSTGIIEANTFSGPNAKVGTIGGANQTAIRWSENRVACLGGLTISGGIVTGGGNEYSNADNGVDVAPTASTTLDIGPDIFKAGVTGNSYRIAADSSLLGGRINYIAEQDSSNSRFSSVTTRVTIENVDKRFQTLAVSGTTLSPYFSGRTYNVTVAGTAQLPTPIPGTRLRILKVGATALTITTTPGSSFVAGVSGSRNSAVATDSETGACIEFVALSNEVWIAQVLSGTWTFS